jgi:site-specific DNA-adenine methylase
MKPMFSYFGSKYRLAPHYPRPLDGVPVVEPFAGSAAYSLFYNAPMAFLFDKNPVVCGVWDYLIHVEPAELMKLPDRIAGDIPSGLAPEARALIGFWLAKARGRPALRAGSWSTNYYSESNAHVWGPAVKKRLSIQVEKIRNWRVCNEDFSKAPDMRATWFIDPPYVTTARNTYKFKDVDYAKLAAFSLDRTGLVINCDDISAKYLAFKEFRKTQGVSKNSFEAVYIRTSEV